VTKGYYPLNSLKEGHWFKLICGASFQHLPAVRNLTLVYALAGADCIDVAADPAAIAAAREALQLAQDLGSRAQNRGFGFQGRPWLMVSFNDGEDPHFRKAEFNPAACPTDCWRPCEKVCPAEAITFSGLNFTGVIEERCYGCGRCLPACPRELIYARSYVSTPEAVAPLVLETGVDAIEIHTQIGREKDFKRLWQSVRPWVGRLKLVAISCTDGPGLIEYLRKLYEIISPLPCALIWQTDGRPMSGDLGVGTANAAVKLRQKVLAAGLPGYIQLAGGTNDRTVEKLASAGLLSDKRNSKTRRSDFVAGVAYGSYARVLLSPILEKLEKMHSYQTELEAILQSDGNFSSIELETVEELLWEAASKADSLVSQIKRRVRGFS
jgi:Fe-S-cluster-containing hydrogenase component 2